MSGIAGRAMKSAASARLSELTGAAKAGARPPSQRINWEDFNFPCGREPCNIIHFDLGELERIDERAHSTVRLVYIWFLILLAVVFVNFINTIVIAAGVGNSAIYSGVNVVYAIFNIILGSSGGLFVLYNVYRGLADPSPTFKRRGLVVLAILLVCAFLQAILGGGNTNGLGNLGSARMDAAVAADLGIVGYWTAMVVIESLVWFGNVGIGGFALYRIWTH